MKTITIKEDLLKGHLESIIDDLRRDNERYKEALEIYAREESYKPMGMSGESLIGKLKGKIAQAALEGEK